MPANPTAVWFRSWHGAPTDNKWLAIARRACVPPGMVSAIVWAMLDYASQNRECRGSTQGFDPEGYSAWAGYEEEDVLRVIQAMQEKGVLGQDPDRMFAAWDERQPKREDPSASDRKRRQRAPQEEGLNEPSRRVTPKSRNVTQCHADVTPGSRNVPHRGEERRVEKSREEKKEASPNGDVLPASGSADDDKYAFAEGHVRLTHKDLTKLSKAFPNTNVLGLLLARAEILKTKPKSEWFAAFRSMCRKADEDGSLAKERQKIVAESHKQGGTANGGLRHGFKLAH